MTTITSNLEIEKGSDTLKQFSLKDLSTGLPKNLTGAVVEFQITFETWPIPIIFRSDISPNIVLGGMLGTIKVLVPWLDRFNTDYGMGNYTLYVKYPNGINVLEYKGFVTIIRGIGDTPLPGETIPDDPFPGVVKGPQSAEESQSVVLASDHPTINVSSTGGLGSLAVVPAGSSVGVAIGDQPAKAVGVRIYLGTSDSVTFTISGSQPTVAPDVTFTISSADTGPNWDENLSSGQMMYVVSITGAPKFRWI